MTKQTTTPVRVRRASKKVTEPEVITTEVITPVEGCNDELYGLLPELSGVVTVREDEMTGAVAFTVPNPKRQGAASSSWQDPTVRAARMTKHAVECDGVYYTSLAQAFKAHNLPMSKFHKFRLDLKSVGEQVGWGHDFTLVPVKKAA